jgi:hypothetical protein
VTDAPDPTRPATGEGGGDARPAGDGETIEVPPEGWHGGQAPAAGVFDRDLVILGRQGRCQSDDRRLDARDGKAAMATDHQRRSISGSMYDDEWRASTHLARDGDLRERSVDTFEPVHLGR